MSTKNAIKIKFAADLSYNVFSSLLIAISACLCWFFRIAQQIETSYEDVKIAIDVFPWLIHVNLKSLTEYFVQLIRHFSHFQLQCVFQCARAERKMVNSQRSLSIHRNQKSLVSSGFVYFFKFFSLHYLSLW